MSQRGPAPHPSSRRSSQSPPRDVASSSPTQRSLAHQDDSNPRPPHDPGGVVGEDERGGQRRGSRASGVHNILNPLGARGAPPTGSSPPLSRPPHEASPQMKMERGQYGGNSSPSRSAQYLPPGSMTPQQSHPAGPHTQSPGVPLPSGSPPAPYQLAAARRILTPKSPRAASLSRAAMRTVEAQRVSSLPPHPGRATALPHDASPLGAPPALGASPQFPGPPVQPPGTPGPPLTRPTSGLGRSLSQPVLGHGLPPTTQEGPPTSNPPREPGARPGYPGPSGPAYPVPAPPNRGLPGEVRWGPVVSSLPPGGSMTRHLQLGEGQQHILAITPDHGPEILIPVDYHQASKQADEKRQRNAGASARFRQRKKEREKEQQAGLQKLESQNRELERRVEELERRNEELEEHRDFYRNERNRLRDIVARTPGISEWADRGPPSPTPTPSRSVSSYAANSPLPAPAPTPLPQPQPHPHPHPHPHAYTHSHALAHPHPPPSSYGDPSMMERPARRRRTDSEATLSSSYRPTTPASLPPMPGPPPAYSIPPSPHMAPSPGTARLPPIRFEHPPPPSETPPPAQSGAPPPPVHTQPGQTSAYPSYSKAPYETGWATAPRGPHDGPSR